MLPPHLPAPFLPTPLPATCHSPHSGKRGVSSTARGDGQELLPASSCSLALHAPGPPATLLGFLPPRPISSSPQHPVAAVPRGSSSLTGGPCHLPPRPFAVFPALLTCLARPRKAFSPFLGKGNPLPQVTAMGEDFGWETWPPLLGPVHSPSQLCYGKEVTTLAEGVQG